MPRRELHDVGADERRGGAWRHHREVRHRGRPGRERVAQNRRVDNAATRHAGTRRHLVAADRREARGHDVVLDLTAGPLEQVEHRQAGLVDDVADRPHVDARPQRVGAGAARVIVRLVGNGPPVDLTEAQAQRRRPGTVAVGPLAAGVEQQVDPFSRGQQVAPRASAPPRPDWARRTVRAAGAALPGAQDLPR